MKKTSIFLMCILLSFNSCTEEEYNKPLASEEKFIMGHDEKLNKKYLTLGDFLKLDNTTEVNNFAKKYISDNKLAKSSSIQLDNENYILEIESFNQTTYTFFINSDENGLLNFVVKKTPKKTTYYLILYPTNYSPYKKDETKTKVKIKEISKSELSLFGFTQAKGSSILDGFGNVCTQYIACSENYHTENNISDWTKCVAVRKPQLIIVDCDIDIPYPNTGGGNDSGHGGTNPGYGGTGGGGTGNGIGGGDSNDPYNPKNPGNGQQEPIDIITDPNTGQDIARLIRIQNEIFLNPYLILKDIPCDEFQHWKSIYEYEIPQLVHDRIYELQHTYGNNEKSFYLHDIKNAYGPVVNMDFFPITIHNFPIKPGTNRPYEAREFFEEIMRINLNTLLKDGPANFNGYSNADQTNWNRIYGNVLSVMMRFDINAGLGIFSQDGSVITIESSPNKWKFATIRTPQDSDHPVSGTREFGYYVDLNGKHVFYTRGIDRITRIDDTFNGDFIGKNFGNGENAAFEGADKLWNTFQKNLLEQITKDGVGKATINQDYTSRPDFSQFLKVLKGQAELNTLPNFEPKCK
jgi:hypothetical protein